MLFCVVGLVALLTEFETLAKMTNVRLPLGLNSQVSSCIVLQQKAIHKTIFSCRSGKDNILTQWKGGAIAMLFNCDCDDLLQSGHVQVNPPPPPGGGV